MDPQPEINPQPFTPEVNSAPTSGVEKSKPSRSWIVVLLILLCLTSLATAGYFSYQNQQLKKLAIIPTSTFQPTLTPTNDTPNGTSTTSWQTYTNTKFGYSFIYPSHAKLYEVSDGYHDPEATPGSELLELRIPVGEHHYNFDIDPTATYTPRYSDQTVPKFKSLRDYVTYLEYIEGDHIPRQGIAYDIEHDNDYQILEFADLSVHGKPAVYLHTETLPEQGASAEIGHNEAFIEYQPGKLLTISGFPQYLETHTYYLHQILNSFVFADDKSSDIDWDQYRDTQNWKTFKSDSQAALRKTFSFSYPPIFTTKDIDGATVHLIYKNETFLNLDQFFANPTQGSFEEYLWNWYKPSLDPNEKPDTITPVTSFTPPYEVYRAKFSRPGQCIGGYYDLSQWSCYYVSIGNGNRHIVVVDHGKIPEDIINNLIKTIKYN